MIRKVRVENGVVQGLPAADPRVTSFKGIPFAKPPVGENRWKAPKKAENWEGVLKAYEFAPISMQPKLGNDDSNIYNREWNVDPDIKMDEDCLYLNVWTPSKSKDEKLPVFVWYFGGALQFGNTAEMEFDGERIARRGIVVVTINYRLNVFGFLCHPEITKESPEAPANFGNLDQKAGTEWVRRNIEEFGGDPDNITIGGQSAGGGSVLSQIVSPQNENFCTKAFIESGIWAQTYPGDFLPFGMTTLEEAEKEGVKFFDFLGVSSLSEARKLDAKYIRDKFWEYKVFWGTVIDNKFSTGDAFNNFLNNKCLDIPIMMGHTSSEFMSTPNVKNFEEFNKLAKEMFAEDAEEFLELTRAKFTDNIEELKVNAKLSPIEYAIRLKGQAKANTGNNTPMYYYNFDAEIPGWDNPGTFHSVDLWFFFETLAKCWRPFVGKHYDLARQMCNYLANFIKCGDPNGKDSTGENMTTWNDYNVKEPYAMNFKDKPEFIKENPSALMNFMIKEYFKNKK